MSFTHRARYVNPRLGTYIGIFMSAFAALAVTSLIFEGLGVTQGSLGLLMLAGPLALYVVIGLAAATSEPTDYFTAGRRVPAFYSGLALAQTAMGATGLVALAGSFFFIGFDALCLVIGGLAGFVVMAVMLAPFYRKFGAYTLPSYLGRRFESRLVRIVAAAIIAVPMLLMLAAEIRMGSYAMSWLWGRQGASTTAFLVVALILTLTAGGMRSLTWSTAAESIASLAAILVPLTIVAVIVTSLPFPQLSAGPVLRVLGRAEAAQGLPIIIPPAFAFDFPGEGLTQIGKRYADAFADVGPGAFVIATLSTLAGVAAAPWLLPRVGATPGVYEARKALGWATLLFGITMLSLASAAIFMRDYLMDVVTAAGNVRVPDWLATLKSYHLVDFDAEAKRLNFAGLSMNRDAVLMSLPIAAEMPQVAVYLSAAGIVAAALAAAGALAVSLGGTVAEDVVNGLSWQPPPPAARLAVARIAVAGVTALGGVIAVVAPTDPLKLMFWALALTGASLFPVLILSIWWKRINAFGTLAGMVTGFSVTVLAILAGEAGLIGLASPLAAVVGMPAGAAAALVVASITPAPGRHMLEFVRDIRVPGGEIIYDREMRLQRRQRR